MSIFEEVFANFDQTSGPASHEDVAKCEALLGRSLPDETKQFLTSCGWGGGFASEAEDAEFITLFSPIEISECQPPQLPSWLIIVGSSGGGEWIVANSQAGFGLLPAISDWQTDYYHVASNFKEFLFRSIHGQWFAE